MTSPILLLPSLLVLALVCPWNSNALPAKENLDSLGPEEKREPIPDPAKGDCKTDKNPKGLGFIGVKYNLIRGNPEGETEKGGADPGLEITKKILKLTNDSGNAVPDQICYERRQLCSDSKSTSIFSGTKRYQEKLNVDVKAEAGYSGLFDFSFSLSTKYENVKKSSQSGETVFRDRTKICNKGEARYISGSVNDNQYTLTDEFATDVCQLTVKYRSTDQKQKYFDFLESWGTHVVTHVVLGTKIIKRFKSTLQEFMNYASKNVGTSVSVSGGYGGATGSVSVDVDKFEESEETNKEFGNYSLTYTVGGDDFPEPIQITLMGIEETLNKKFWSNLDELKKTPSCKRMSLTKLEKFCKNMKKAIEDYPKKLRLKRAKDNPMELKLSWPSGYYSLFTARKDGNGVCPQGSGFQWRPGSVTDQNHAIINATENKLIGIQEHIASAGWKRGVKYGFCTKTEDPGRKFFSQAWPKGKYCIVRKSSNPGSRECPKSFEVAVLVWNDEYTHDTPDGHLRAPVTNGTIPDGSFGSDRYLKIEVCCRQDGFVANGIHLPIENPFILMNIQGYSCQKVCGAQVTPVAVRTAADTPYFYLPNSGINGKVKPAGMNNKHELELHFCHYQKTDDAKFTELELVTTSMKARTAERECKAKGGHLVSIHSRAEKDRVIEVMGDEDRVWIGLHQRTVGDKPWVWYDDTELNFGEWKPDVIADGQTYVAMSKDGSWQAMTNDNKVPFVCKLINPCP